MFRHTAGAAPVSLFPDIPTLTTRVVSDTKKFDRGLSTLLHDKLHWLDVPERVTFKLGLITYRCLHGQASRYLADHIKPAIEVSSRHRQCSANRHWLIVPRCWLNMYACRAFPVAGPTVWNGLPDELRDPACDIDSFKQFLKTILIVSTSVTSALEVNYQYALYKFTVYLLTYFTY